MSYLDYVAIGAHVLARPAMLLTICYFFIWMVSLFLSRDPGPKLHQFQIVMNKITGISFLTTVFLQVVWFVFS